LIKPAAGNRKHDGRAPHTPVLRVGGLGLFYAEGLEALLWIKTFLE
jgi:hypothetical protein